MKIGEIALARKTVTPRNQEVREIASVCVKRPVFDPFKHDRPRITDREQS